MSERAIIAASLGFFLAGACFPFWRNAARPPRPLDLRLPQGQRECVAPVDYMRTSHGDLLEDWRDRVVRSGERFTRSRHAVAWCARASDSSPLPAAAFAR